MDLKYIYIQPVAGIPDNHKRDKAFLAFCRASPPLNIRTAILYQYFV